MSKKEKKNKKDKSQAKIKVIGVGGGGNNAISRMFDDLPRGIDLIAINTDTQDLNYTKARKKINIGKSVTRGLGTGMNPDLGRQAAEENRAEISEALEGADMVFITAGMGGGTGTGASPVVADVSRELGILTVAIVTKPFSFEGSQRNRIAQEGIARIKDRVDTLITIPNDRIFSLINKNTSLLKAFEEIDAVLKSSVQGIVELIMTPGIINVDFADVKTIMREAGPSIISSGIASGQDRAIKAATLAINSPLLEVSIDGAKGVLFSVSGHRDLKMNEVNDIAKLISENIDQTAKIIFGTYYDRKLRVGELKVTLIATGFNGGINKNNVLFPNLFTTAGVPRPEGESGVKDGKEEGKIDSKQHRLVETDSSKKKENKEKEDIWDIPAFLRKKKR